MEKLSRRRFFKTAGVATGTAVVAGAPGFVGAATAAAEPDPRAVAPQGRVPEEPVVAYLREGEHGEVTVLSGTHEITFRDRGLARRLLRAARIAERE